MKNIQYIATAIAITLASCSQGNDKTTAAGKDSTKANTVATDTAKGVINKPMADLATILAQKEVPVLCYHHIRAIKPGESESMKSYSVTPAQFAEQMKALNDSGYKTILPDQLYEYLVHGTALPAKPVMLTYDDTDEEQFSIAKPEMDKYGFKGVYFLMTISINRPRYMTKEQIKQLSDEGHVMAAHTWDHHMVTKLQGEDWNKQLVEPKDKIKSITGKTVNYFAYPFGIWNPSVIPEIKKADYKLAFILSTKRDTTEPLHTIRRMIVPSQWSTNGMMKAMKSTFHL
jgi:peptidoglycan/xylan/chitin deacetylase (PgdA/CDA1 family)